MQVTRLRRRAEKGMLRGRRGRLIAAAGVSSALVFTGTGIGYAQTTMFGRDQVGQTTANGLVAPSDQYLAPIGERLVINPGKIMSSSVSPDGTHMAASVTDGGVAMVIVDLKEWKVQQTVGNNAAANLRIPGNDVGQEGPTYSPDGSSLWLGQADGYTKFTVNADGTLANPVKVTIPAVDGKRALVGEAVFSADGKTVYGAVNGQNRVVAIDAATGALTQGWNVGIAPRDMLLLGGKLYISNEGGRQAQPGEFTLNSYGTQVPADPTTAASTTGTVSVIDVADAAATPSSIDVGLHPTALYAKNGALFVTNTVSDTVSVIDTAIDQVVQTIATQPWAESQVGYAPNAVTLTDDGHLLVTLGRANAIAVYKFTNALEPVSYVGLLPADFFPAEITTVNGEVVVSNTRGIGARRSSTNRHGTHDTTSSLTHFTLPSDEVIKGSTGKVFTQNGWHGSSVAKADEVAKPHPVPVPVKLGDPSTIKYVFLIIKENRTYDGVFGDIEEGNGDPAFTTYGENVTPNQHAMARQFALYDNAYDIATNSAEGHNWLMQADDPEYTESSAGEYERSYGTSDDALGHTRAGFLWTGAQAAGKTVRNFGQYTSSMQRPASASWQNLYCDTLNMRATGADSAYKFAVGSVIPSLQATVVPEFPAYNLTIPDIYRAEIWKRDFEKNGPANLNMIRVGNDHTGGTASGPAQVADNDLATGRVVEAISHSPYWMKSAIFVIEDDTQSGADHVDGHRGPIQVISPWANHGIVDSHYYTQITMVRTIEQILGIQPMNQKDSAASPMRQAFSGTADPTPFTAVPNRTSLTDGVKTLPSCGADVPAPANPAAAPVPSTAVPADKQALAAQWDDWKAKQHLAGPEAQADRTNPSQLNHFDWYEAHGWKKPYPGEDKFYAPDDVPGAYIPAAEVD
ncbi:phosphoesterase [Micromonospora yasonensis]|uniref:bifunctional YncE family protein/alkaline phosphatase family protein n=1 Tax=Micromonospora yasonensis TaxID=1128667 RepID=UPI00223050C2|nr:bifunctional YncE family protein/alkaline phosphatase family protein [Micromonospora yasonensis]MCW3845130.1 phosphoesterase [Micromonospora yasonensis]